jgi:hypothetical protein
MAWTVGREGGWFANSGTITPLKFLGPCGMPSETCNLRLALNSAVFRVPFGHSELGLGRAIIREGPSHIPAL